MDNQTEQTEGMTMDEYEGLGDIVFSLDHLAGDVWVAELYYRMVGSSIGDEKDLADAVGVEYLETGDAYALDEFAGDALVVILEDNGLTVYEGNVVEMIETEA